MHLLAWIVYYLNCLSNRSPWSNEYDPPIDDGTVPSSKLRKLEITANEAFDTYREMWVPILVLTLLPLQACLPNQVLRGRCFISFPVGFR